MQVSLSTPTQNTYNGDQAIADLSNCVKNILLSILKDRIPNFKVAWPEYLNRFTAVEKLSDCDQRTQKLYCNIVKAVKEDLGRNPVLKPAAASANDSAYFIHFALQPTKDLIKKLDAEQPGAVDDFIKPTKETSVRASLEDLKILNEGLKKADGILLLSPERLNELKGDRADLLANAPVPQDQQERLDLLNALIAKCEANGK